MLNSEDLVARDAEHEARSSWLQTRVKECEEQRVARWHATRDASLTGLLARFDHVSTRNAIEIASAYADAAHGAIK